MCKYRAHIDGVSKQQTGTSHNNEKVEDLKVIR